MNKRKKRTREQDEGRGRGLGTKGMRQKEGGDNDTEPNLGGEAHFIKRNLPVMQLLQQPPDARVYRIHRIVPLCSIFLKKNLPVRENVVKLEKGCRHNILL